MGGGGALHSLRRVTRQPGVCERLSHVRFVARLAYADGDVHSAIGRYAEGVWWHRRGSSSDGTCELELHTSRNDPVHPEPVLSTMASAARCTINDNHAALHAHDEPPALDPATGKYTSAPTAAAAAAAASQALQPPQQPGKQQDQQQQAQSQPPQQPQKKSGTRKRKRSSSTTRRASALAAAPATSSTAAPSVAAVSAAAAACSSAVPWTPPTPQQVAERDALAAIDAAVADSEVPPLPTNVPDDENDESAPPDNTEASVAKRYDTCCCTLLLALVTPICSPSLDRVGLCRSVTSKLRVFRVFLNCA